MLLSSVICCKETVGGGTVGLCHGACLTISMGERDTVGWFSYAIPPSVCNQLFCLSIDYR
jgi:hypothetical protein